MNPRFTPINQSQEQSPKNPNQQRFTPVKQEDFSNTGYAGELKAFEKERSFTDFDKTIDELPFWGGETTYKFGDKEFSVSGMFSDGEKEKLKEFKRNPNISDDQFELAKATMGSAAAYYFDDNGFPRGLMPGQKPPKGKEIASIWGTQSEAEDDGLVTTAAKNIFSAIPGIIDNIADLAHLPYGLVTGKEADWYKEVKQTTESLRFKTSSESQKSILDTEGIDEMSDIFDSKRWNVSADNVVGTASSLVGTVIEFLAGGELAKSVGIGGKALAKVASSEAVGIGTKLASKTPYFVGGYMTNLGEALDAADEAGVKGKDKYTIAALVTLPVSAIEMVGGLEAKVMNNAIKQKEKSAMIKTLVKEFVKDNEGNLTKKGLKELYDASKVASTSVFTKMGKEFIETGAGEAGEEVLQNITQKASQQIYDNLFAEGKEVGKGRYGTKITSPESVAEYINDAIGGLIGGAGGNLMNARSDFRKAKAELQSEQAFSTIKKGKDAIKDLKAEIQSYQKAGQITPEQTEMAFHKIDKYNEYFEAIKGHDLTDEEKKRVSDLNWTGENLKVQMEALKNNPKAKDETSIQYKQLSVLQKIYKAADKEIEETLTKPLADEQLAVPVSIQRDIENKTETTPPKKSGFKMKSVAKLDTNQDIVNSETDIEKDSLQPIVGKSDSNLLYDNDEQRDKLKEISSTTSIGSYLDKNVQYDLGDGEWVYGKLSKEEDGAVVLKTNNKEYEIGRYEGIKTDALSVHRLNVVSEEKEDDLNSPTVSIKGKSIEINGKKYVNNYSNPLSAINRDSDGNIVSVDLETENGKKRTFRKTSADDIAYNILLASFEDNKNETKLEVLENLIINAENESKSPKSKRREDRRIKKEIKKSSKEKAIRNSVENRREQKEVNKKKTILSSVMSKEEAKELAEKTNKEIDNEIKEVSAGISIELTDEVKDTPIFEGTFKEALSEFEKEKEVEGTVVPRGNVAKGALLVEVNGKSYKIASSGDFDKTGGSFGAKAKQEVGKKVKLRIVKKADWNADGKIINKTTGLPYGDKIEILNSKGEVIGKVQESYEKTKEQPIQEAVKPMDKKEKPEKEIKVEVKNNYEDMSDKDIAEMPQFKEFKEKEAKEYNEKDAIEYFKKCKSRK